MPSSSSSHHGLVAILCIGISTVIGLFAGLVAHDMGIVSTWFWIGTALAVTYLLTVIANSLDQLNTDN